MSWMDRRRSSRQRYTSAEAENRNASGARRLTAESLLEEIDAGNLEILTRVEEEGTILGEKLEQQKQDILGELREQQDTQAWLADLRTQLKAGFEEEERASEEQFEIVRAKLNDLFEDQKDYVTEQIRNLDDSVAEQITGLKESISEGRQHVLDTIAGNKADLAERFEELAEGRQEVLDTIAGSKVDLISKFDAIEENQKEIERTLCEKIHSSSVKNYRNIQSLVEEQSSKAVTANLDASSIQEINHSFKGLKAMAAISCIGGLCGIAALVYAVCTMLGLI